MSTADKNFAASKIGPLIGVKFQSDELRLGTWGSSDRYAILRDNTFLILEVESQQKHPSTNVAKIWPWLEENPSYRVLLIQVYLTGSPGITSNRGRIATWLGAKMEDFLEGRFRYFRWVLNEQHLEEDVDEIRLAVQDFST